MSAGTRALGGPVLGGVPRTPGPVLGARLELPPHGNGVLWWLHLPFTVGIKMATGFRGFPSRMPLSWGPVYPPSALRAVRGTLPGLEGMSGVRVVSRVGAVRVAQWLQEPWVLRTTCLAASAVNSLGDPTWGPEFTTSAHLMYQGQEVSRSGMVACLAWCIGHCRPATKYAGHSHCRRCTAVRLLVGFPVGLSFSSLLSHAVAICQTGPAYH